MVRKLLPVAAAFAVCGAATASAQAMTISVGPTASLSSRVAVTAPVTVSCTPFDPSLTLVDETINVTVEQASGRSVAHGTGSAGAFTPSLLFACDNSQATIPVTISADTSGPPFHGGTAVATAMAFAQAGIPCGFPAPGCFQILDSQTATSSATTVRMH
jgi:hypothetical protein